MVWGGGSQAVASSWIITGSGWGSVLLLGITGELGRHTGLCPCTVRSLCVRKRSWTPLGTLPGEHAVELDAALSLGIPGPTLSYTWPSPLIYIPGPALSYSMLRYADMSDFPMVTFPHFP